MSKYGLWKELDADLTLDLIFNQLKEINKKSDVYPSRDKVFKAFEVPYNEVKAWVDANTSEYIDEASDGDSSDRWCNNCEKHIDFITLEEFNESKK